MNQFNWGDGDLTMENRVSPLDITSGLLGGQYTYEPVLKWDDPPSIWNCLVKITIYHIWQTLANIIIRKL